MRVNRLKKRELVPEVYNIIRNDIPLRHKIAEALNIEAESVYRAAFRKSKKFSLPFIVGIITKHTGKSESEILEN